MSLKDSSGTIVFPGFPADVLLGFRLYSVAAQLILWATIGLVFSPMVERLLGTIAPLRTREPATVAS